jgi:GH25 family lysozyme M1 (1,4-beta-N-acetylmuramidase)
MPDNLVVNNGNVLLIDPNLVNVNPNMTNAIPQYQDMFIFAELTATRRARTVLVTGLQGIGSYSTENTGANKAISVNFLGTNQDPESPNYLKFTTNWYDGSTGNRTQFEGFGIGSIKVVINSSFIPQVNIQFIDLRGLAFFNQENSPYRTIFDFPPPIFTLKIKGYYGRALEYQLHLVKYTTEFKAENGNFIIDAQFVAMTFAPLADILFRYVVNFPLMSGTISMNSNSSQPPQNTYELILKLKNLYSGNVDKLKTTGEQQAYDNIISKINSIDELLSSLSFFKEDSGLGIQGTPISLISSFNSVTSVLNIAPIASIFDYNSIIGISADSGVPESINQRLLIAYLGSVSTQTTSFLGVTPNDNKISALKAYRHKLLTNPIANLYVDDNDIPQPKEIAGTNAPNFVTVNNDNYISLDVTYYYTKLYKKKIELQKQKTAIMNQMNTIINNMIVQELGMKLTIYNIFKIILNDVDTFFKTLRNTSKDAEERHHVKHRSQILTESFQDFGGGDKETIYAFPLIIQRKKEQCAIKEIRIAPIELSNSIIGDPFPELVLVQKFIDSFITQRQLAEQAEMKSAQNADGTYKWIPISPFDSILGTPENKSPYYGVDSTGGGSTPQPINMSQYPRMVQVMAIILKRFYILSQYVHPNRFYDDDAYANLFSESEAINLIASISNPIYVELLAQFAKDYMGRPDAFYEWINVNIPNLYKFPANKYELFNILNGADIDNIGDPKGDAYVNKDDFYFRGFTVHEQTLSIQVPPTDTSTTSTDNPIQTFMNKTAQTGWNKFWKGQKLEGFLKFTNENVFFIRDNNSKDGGDNLDIKRKTRFLTTSGYIGLIRMDDLLQTQMEYSIQPQAEYYGQSTSSNSGIASTNRISFINTINTIVDGAPNGNTAFKKLIPKAVGGDVYNSLGDIVDVWTDQLSRHDEEIYEEIINASGLQYNQHLSSIIIASNFGYSLSPFSTYPTKLNETFFSIPAAVEVPSCLPYYMGSLVGISAKTTDIKYQTLYNFFISGSGKALDSSGAFIFADIADINAQLAYQDNFFIGELYNNDFINGGIHENIITELKNVYDNVQSDPEVIKAKATGNASKIAIAKAVVYKKAFDPDDDNSSFSKILQPLMNKFNIINFSELTFGRNVKSMLLYKSLSTTNNDKTNTKLKDSNNNFFKVFFQKLNAGIIAKQKQIKDQKAEDEKSTGDEDIVTQTYYSFKNINDKWLSGPQNNDPNAGYPTFERKVSPFHGGSATPHLIDSFVFVDRAMNPIGDTIINPQVLTDMLEDPSLSIYSVLSQLLSLNGFEFFPLQNFMKFEKPMDWQDSFTIDTTGDVIQGPIFMCMYIGGGSSYPSGIQAFGQFKDDGITDLLATNLPDFSKGDCNIDTKDDNQATTNPDFPFRQVRAFRVRFGEQNQSMFTNIRIDSKDYPETNESLAILARLAGDNKLNAPTPKGQNLYNLYENRAYRATVTGLGNAMIQPTQYFQVENVPLYNGAYLVLSVEHQIDPNKMTTTFSGTKILKYPVPRVLESSVVTGYPGGNTNNTNPAAASQDGSHEGTEVAGMTPERLKMLNSVLGIDSSHYQGNINWKLVKDSKVDFALIKVTEGNTFYEGNSTTYNLIKNISNAQNNGIKVGYYHFARPGNNADPKIDATYEANWFVSHVKGLPAVDFPLVLDIEAYSNTVLWIDRKADMQIFVSTFIDILKSNGFSTIIYSYKSFLDDNGITNFGNNKLWIANYMKYPITNPERDLPSLPVGWKGKDWLAHQNVPIWQFSSQGQVNGIQGNVDINVMKNDFFKNSCA